MGLLQALGLLWLAGCGDGGNAVTATPPILTVLNPATAVVGSPAFILAATGANITPQTVVQWAGVPLSSAYESGQEIAALVPAADLTTAGSYPITLVTDGKSSAALQFTVQPAPIITQLSPNSATAGAAGFVLAVFGNNFTGQSVVNWGGSPRSTSYGSTSQVTAQISAADIAAVGTIAVTVKTQEVSSAPSNFTILPAVEISSVTPSTVSSGGPAFMLTVNGSGFTAASTVLWNGSARVTTYQSASLLTAQILASDIAAPGSAAVAVQNPGNQGGASPPAIVTIRPASVDAVSFQINPTHSGAITFQSVSLPEGALWSVDVGGPASFALIAQNLVIVTVTTDIEDGGFTELIALDQSSGAKVWGPIAISGVASAAYDNGMVFAVNGSGLMQAYNATNGNLIWTTKLPDQEFFSSGVTALNGFVYTTGAGSGGTAYALSETTGAVIWTAGLNNGTNTTPAVTADGVYVADACRAYDWNPASGASVWINYGNDCDAGQGGTSVVANGLLYQPGENTGRGYTGDTLNAETGALVSSFVIENPPAVGATNGYFLQSGTLRGVELSSNSVLWSFAGDGQLVSDPVLVNNFVFIGSSSGNLYALDGTSGAQLWQMNVGAAIPANGAGNYGGIPFYGLSAGDGLLVVPAGSTVTAYLMSSSP
jgi:outer membrane protein assembly factor BamB